MVLMHKLEFGNWERIRMEIRKVTHPPTHPPLDLSLLPLFSYSSHPPTHPPVNLPASGSSPTHPPTHPPTYTQSERFAFDWWLKSRTSLELSKRGDVLVRLIEKELEAIDGVAPKRVSGWVGG